MPASSFTIKNTSDGYALDVKITGGGPAREASLIPGEEQSFEVAEGSKVTVNQGAITAQPTPHR